MVVTPDESLVYHYNGAHELTDVQSAFAGGQPYSEAFDYDSAGALIGRTIFNPSRKSRMPIPGDLTNLPTERYTYTRDPLGRVTEAQRAVANSTGTAFDSTVLASFSHYADTYKIRQRAVRQSASENYAWTQPVYAGSAELADVTAHAAPETPSALIQEYLTGGTDEILAQYTPEDLAGGSFGFANSATHPVQDVNRRVYMTLHAVTGQSTQIAERAVYSAFGERNVLERTTTDPFGTTWAPRGFGAQNVGGPRPNGLSDPLSNVGQTHGFQGRRHEDMPGIMDFRNRLYDPRLGRFLERDPKNDPNNPNPYAFEANNPVNNLDPMGSTLITEDEQRAIDWVNELKAAGYNATYMPIRSSGNRDPRTSGTGYAVVTWDLNSNKSNPPDLQLASSLSNKIPIWMMADYAQIGRSYRLEDGWLFGVRFVKTDDVSPVEFKEAVTTGAAVGSANWVRSKADTGISLVTLGKEMFYFGPVQGYAGSTASYAAARTGDELILALGTAGLAEFRYVAYAPHVVKTINFMQWARSGVTAAEGGYDMVVNGPGLANQAQFYGGLLGFKAFYGPAFGAEPAISSIIKSTPSATGGGNVIPPSSAPEFGPVLSPLQGNLDDLAAMRGRLGGVPGKGQPNGGVVARLDTASGKFWGINAHGQEVTLHVNAISLTHAEAAAFQQAANAGVHGGPAVLNVDSPLCQACGKNGAVISMATQLGFTSLEINTPQGRVLIDLAEAAAAGR